MWGRAGLGAAGRGRGRGGAARDEMAGAKSSALGQGEAVPWRCRAVLRADHSFPDPSWTHATHAGLFARLFASRRRSRLQFCAQSIPSLPALPDLELSPREPPAEISPYYRRQKLTPWIVPHLAQTCGHAIVAIYTVNSKDTLRPWLRRTSIVTLHFRRECFQQRCGGRPRKTKVHCVVP